MVGLTCLYVLVFAATVGAVWYVVGCYEKMSEAEKNQPNDLDNHVDNYSIVPLGRNLETSQDGDNWAELKEDSSDTTYCDENLPKPMATRPMPTFYWDPEYIEEKKAKRKKKAKKAAKSKSKKKKTKKHSEYEF